MKKFIILLFMAITMCVTANAQSKVDWKWFKGENLVSYTIGCDIGGSYKNVMYEPSYVWGISFTCLGVYYDWGSTSPQGINSTDIGVWEGTSASYWHLGYTIPISRYFTIAPIYGQVTTRKGIVNGNDWYVSSDGVTNRFEPNAVSSVSDYGVVITGILTFPTHIPFPFGLSCGCKITKHQTIFNVGMFFDIYSFFRK